MESEVGRQMELASLKSPYRGGIYALRYESDRNVIGP